MADATQGLQQVEIHGQKPYQFCGKRTSGQQVLGAHAWWLDGHVSRKALRESG